MARRKNHAEASQRAAPMVTHMQYTHQILCYVLQFCDSALTLVNTSGQDNVKVTAEANTSKTQTLRPSTPVPHLKRRMGSSPLALQFTRLSVSTFHGFPTDDAWYPPHCYSATGTRNAPHQPSPTATSHSSLSASRYDPHFGRHNADGNQMPTQRCHTGCPASTARQSNRERKRVNWHNFHLLALPLITRAQL
jgi:hypothetical protein